MAAGQAERQPPGQQKCRHGCESWALPLHFLAGGPRSCCSRRAGGIRDRGRGRGEETRRFPGQVGGDLPVLENEVGERVDGRNLLVSLVDRRVENFFRVKGEDKRPVTLKLATFQGTLKVTDPRALRSALANGIGRAKGYGAGLLTLARP